MEAEQASEGRQRYEEHDRYEESDGRHFWTHTKNMFLHLRVLNYGQDHFIIHIYIYIYTIVISSRHPKHVKVPGEILSS